MYFTGQNVFRTMKLASILLILVIFSSFALALGEQAQQVQDATIELNSVVSTAEFAYSGKIDLTPIPEILRECLQSKLNYENKETTITITYNQLCQFIGSVRLELLDPTKSSNLRGDRSHIDIYLSPSADVLIVTDRRKLEENLPTNYYETISKYIDKATNLGLSAKYVELNNLERTENVPDSTVFQSSNYYLVHYGYLSPDTGAQSAIKQITSILSPKLLYVLGGNSVIPSFEIPKSEVVLGEKIYSDEPYVLETANANEIKVVDDASVIDDAYVYSSNDFEKLTVIGISKYAIPIDLTNHFVFYNTPNGGFYAQRRHGRHNGVDFLALIGVPVFAADSGNINDARFVPESCGNMLVIKTDSGNEIDWFKYCHLDHFAPGIQKGVHVEKGQLIAYSGNTQSVKQGAHLHFEAYSGGKWASEKNDATAIDPAIIYPNIKFPKIAYNQITELKVDLTMVTRVVTSRLYTSATDKNPGQTIARYLHAAALENQITSPAFILNGKGTNKALQTNSNNLFLHFKTNQECNTQNNCFQVPSTCLQNSLLCDANSKQSLARYNSLILNVLGSATSSFVNINGDLVSFASASELFATIKTPAVIIAEQGDALNVIDGENEIPNSFTLEAIKTGSTIVGRNGQHLLKLLQQVPPKEYTAFELVSEMKSIALSEQDTISTLQWLTAKQLAIVGDPLAKINLS